VKAILCNASQTRKIPVYNLKEQYVEKVKLHGSPKLQPHVLINGLGTKKAKFSVKLFAILKKNAIYIVSLEQN